MIESVDLVHHAVLQLAELSVAFEWVVFRWVGQHLGMPLLYYDYSQVLTAYSGDHSASNQEGAAGEALLLAR